MTSSPTKTKLQAGAGLFVLAAIIISGAVATRSKQSVASNTGQTADKTTDSSCSADVSTAVIKDGTYKTTGSYSSPGGTEKIGVSLTLKDNVVTDSTVTSQANDPTAEAYQSYFINGYKQQVVGKKISDIKLDNVSGSSLTSKGFNQALQNIACQAEAA